MSATADTPRPRIAMPTRSARRGREFWRKFKQQQVALVAGVFVLLLVVVAIVAPWIVPYDAENYFDYDKLNARPSAGALVRRRRARPRHLQPHPDGRAHLARGGVRVGRDRRGDRHAARPARRLLRRLVGPHHHARLRRAVRVSRASCSRSASSRSSAAAWPTSSSRSRSSASRRSRGWCAATRSRSST